MAARRRRTSRPAGGEFPVLFSLQFDIPDPDSFSWFDVTLTRDATVFIDPFLLEFCEELELAGAHEQIFQHFRGIFEVLARDRSASVLSSLTFPEVDEIGLGFTKWGHHGAGTGRHFAREIRDAIVHAIRAGLESPRHFEEIGLLRVGIGQDRISDISARIILNKLAAFTTRCCAELDLPVQRFRVWSYRVETGGLPRQVPFSALLPKNPFSGRPMILVPKSILRSLPTISPPGFEDFLWEFHQEDLRRDFNIEVKRDLGRRVLPIANSNLQWVREYVGYEEERGPRPYDFTRDPSGYVLPTRLGYRWGSDLPSPPQPSNAAQVLTFVRFVARHYKGHIEQQRGFELLWNDGFTRHRNEPIAQRLFQAMARGLCDQNGITMAKETNAGTGPVDFLFSTGYRATVLVELKHVSNERYWDGPAAQLPSYLRAQDASTAMFLAIAYRDREVRSVRYTRLRRRLRDAAAETGFTLVSETIDARPKLVSASRLRRHKRLAIATRLRSKDVRSRP